MCLLLGIKKKRALYEMEPIIKSFVNWNLDLNYLRNKKYLYRKYLPANNVRRISPALFTRLFLSHNGRVYTNGICLLFYLFFYHSACLPISIFNIFIFQICLHHRGFLISFLLHFSLTLLSPPTLAVHFEYTPSDYSHSSFRFHPH